MTLTFYARFKNINLILISTKKLQITWSNKKSLANQGRKCDFKIEFMRKRVLCIGDSMCLPSEFVPYQDTWFFKLSSCLDEYDFSPNF